MLHIASRRDIWMEPGVREFAEILFKRGYFKNIKKYLK